METVFSKNDFVLCKVPVPKGYKQSQTHAGVAIHNGVFYLTTSPYPAYNKPIWKAYLEAGVRRLSGGRLCKPFIAEQWENPCLYVSVGEDNQKPSSFELMQSTPLMMTPDSINGLPAYNSDPDLFIENGVLHVLNRVVYRTRLNDIDGSYEYKSNIFHIYGIIEQKLFKFQGAELLIDSKRNMVSPCLTNYRGEYLLTELETYAYNDGKTFGGLYVSRSKSIDGFKSDNKWEPIQVECEGFLPWHMSLFQDGGKLYSIVSCVKEGTARRLWQLLGEFDEGVTKLVVYNKPLTDYNSYRGSAVVDDNGLFFFYNTTVHEIIKEGMSVDGREVVLAKMPFEILLSSIKEA